MKRFVKVEENRFIRIDRIREIKLIPKIGYWLEIDNIGFGVKVEGDYAENVSRLIFNETI